MNYREKRFVAALLELAGEQFSNHGCNDLPEEVVNLLTPLDREYLQLAWHKWNGDISEYEKDCFFTLDWLWMQYFADLLRQEADAEERI